MRHKSHGTGLFIFPGIHAREWISPAVATFIINELVNSEPEWMDELNFRFLPSANPDGYEYSRTDVSTKQNIREEGGENQNLTNRQNVIKLFTGT